MSIYKIEKLFPRKLICAPRRNFIQNIKEVKIGGEVGINQGLPTAKGNVELTLKNPVRPLVCSRCGYRWIPKVLPFPQKCPNPHCSTRFRY